MAIWEEIRAKFVRPDVHPSRLIDYDLNNLTDDDEVEFESNKQELEMVTGLAVIIEYENAKGERATRLVTCRRLDVHADKKYLFAFCHSREAMRQFRIDRIREIFDHRTGESLNPVDDFFKRYSPSGISNSPLGFGLSVHRRADFLSLLNALVFIARCDTEYHPLERSILENLVVRFWLRLELPNDPDVSAVLATADRLAPDAETFWGALHRIVQQPALVRIMQETAREVIEADGVVKKEEFYWGTKLDQFFRENA
jgi:hypothetical protein